MIMATLDKIHSALPPELAGLEAPELPDTTALRPLADALSTDPSPTERYISSLIDDALTVVRLASEARGLVDAARGDLLSIAVEFLARAIPLAIQALLPHQRATAEAALAVESQAAVEQAEVRSATLSDSLEPVSAQLHFYGEDPPAAEQAGEPEQETSASNMAAQAAVDAALSQLGTPYVWGGSQPGGFDCSGLVQWAYRQAGVELPRTAAEQAIGQPVAYEDLQAGDLVVWDGHVAMYIGDGQMVEAGSPVQTNPVRTTNMGMGFQGFWRPTA